jgi:hypothetical protein
MDLTQTIVKVSLDFHKIAMKHLSGRWASHHYLLRAVLLMIESDVDIFDPEITYDGVVIDQETQFLALDG